MLGMRVGRTETGAPASFGQVLFMRDVIGGFICSIAVACSLGVLVFVLL